MDLKKLAEREKYQVGLASDALLHRNDDVGSEGQKVFSVLLKACNEVKWTSRGRGGKKITGGKKVREGQVKEKDRSRKRKSKVRNGKGNGR